MGCVQAKNSTNSSSGGLDKLKMENGYVGKAGMGHRRSTGQRYNARETGRIQKPEIQRNYNVVYGSGTEEKVIEGQRERNGGRVGGVDGELVDGWPKWLTDNIPLEVLAGLVPKSAESYDKIDKVKSFSLDCILYALIDCK